MGGVHLFTHNSPFSFPPSLSIRRLKCSLFSFLVLFHFISRINTLLLRAGVFKGSEDLKIKIVIICSHYCSSVEHKIRYIEKCLFVSCPYKVNGLPILCSAEESLKQCELIMKILIFSSIVTAKLVIILQTFLFQTNAVLFQKHISLFYTKILSSTTTFSINNNINNNAKS